MRKRGSLLLLIVLGVIVAGTGGALFAFWPQIIDFIDDESMRAERIKRYTLAQTGDTLPGTPDLANLQSRLAAEGLKLGDPIFVRIFKREFELEVWMKRDDRFIRFATYPICMWSGDLGPKLKQGDRQSPEGFYTVESSSLNPNSKYHRSFNLGYPNAFDRAHGRTGDFLMVHGHCLSIGCYAMTDPVIDEIWALVTAALKGGQARFQVQAFPFRMTDANLKRRSHSPLLPFWRNLKAGHDAFEADHVPPVVSVCKGRYAFRSGAPGSDGATPIEQGCPDASAGI